MVSAQLGPAQQIRRCAAACGNDRFEHSREAFRLTVMALDDMPGCLAFVIHEARPHGWWPLISGRITAENELIFTGGKLPCAFTLSQMLDFLLTDHPWIDIPEYVESQPSAY
jgi:hypothetical protein